MRLGHRFFIGDDFKRLMMPLGWEVYSAESIRTAIRVAICTPHHAVLIGALRGGRTRKRETYA
jgi:hypothetical protein